MEIKTLRLPAGGFSFWCNVKKPTLGEVKAYWTGVSRSEGPQLQGNPEEFYDHFEANGWMVGKVPMKDWQAAARNWSRNEIKFSTSAKVSFRQPSSTDINQFNKLMVGKSAADYFQAYRQRFGCDPEGI